MKSKINLDLVGVCTSAFCAVHCLVTPALLVALPFAGLAFLETKSFELGMLIASFLLAIASLVVSFLKRHRKPQALVLAGIGFTFFAVGKLLHVESLEIPLSVVGGVFVVLAHVKNLKLVSALKKA